MNSSSTSPEPSAVNWKWKCEVLAWMTEKPKTSINDAVQEGWGGSGKGVIGAPDDE